jgi:mannose-6-phosphate isomerase-like protein (cupin superfamily)
MAATEEAIAPFQVAKVRPPLVSKGKSSQSLVRAGQLGVGVQVATTDGGETNLHSHPGVDSAWMVLGGRAKFYTVNDRIVGELGKNEIISIPAGTPYWFEAANDDEPLVILHITSRAKDHQGSTRIDYTPRTTGGENRVREIIPDAFFEA